MAFLAAAAPLISTIGTVVGAAGALGGGLYSAQVASNNKAVADKQAEYALAGGEARAGDEGVKNAQREGAIKTAMAANGVDVNTGSNAAVQTSQKITDNLNVDRILSQAGYTAWGYKNQAQNFQAESEADTLGAITGAGATLLEKAPSLSFKWSQSQPTTNDSSWSAGRKTVFG